MIHNERYSNPSFVVHRRLIRLSERVGACSLNQRGKSRSWSIPRDPPSTFSISSIYDTFVYQHCIYLTFKHAKMQDRTFFHLPICKILRKNVNYLSFNIIKSLFSTRIMTCICTYICTDTSQKIFVVIFC